MDFEVSDSPSGEPSVWKRIKICCSRIPLASNIAFCMCVVGSFCFSGGLYVAVISILILLDLAVVAYVTWIVMIIHVSLAIWFLTLGVISSGETRKEISDYFNSFHILGRCCYILAICIAYFFHFIWLIMPLILFLPVAILVGILMSCQFAPSCITVSDMGIPAEYTDMVTTREFFDKIKTFNVSGLEKYIYQGEELASKFISEAEEEGVVDKILDTIEQHTPSITENIHKFSSELNELLDRADPSQYMDLIDSTINKTLNSALEATDRLANINTLEVYLNLVGNRSLSSLINVSSIELPDININPQDVDKLIEKLNDIKNKTIDTIRIEYADLSKNLNIVKNKTLSEMQKYIDLEKISNISNELSVLLDSADPDQYMQLIDSTLNKTLDLASSGPDKFAEIEAFESYMKMLKNNSLLNKLDSNVTLPNANIKSADLDEMLEKLKRLKNETLNNIKSENMTEYTLLIEQRVNGSLHSTAKRSVADSNDSPFDSVRTKTGNILQEKMNRTLNQIFETFQEMILSVDGVHDMSEDILSDIMDNSNYLPPNAMKDADKVSNLLNSVIESSERGFNLVSTLHNLDAYTLNGDPGEIVSILQEIIGKTQSLKSKLNEEITAGSESNHIQASFIKIIKQTLSSSEAMKLEIQTASSLLSSEAGRTIGIKKLDRRVGVALAAEENPKITSGNGLKELSNDSSDQQINDIAEEARGTLVGAVDVRQNNTQETIVTGQESATAAVEETQQNIEDLEQNAQQNVEEIEQNAGEAIQDAAETLTEDAKNSLGKLQQETEATLRKGQQGADELARKSEEWVETGADASEQVVRDVVDEAQHLAADAKDAADAALLEAADAIEKADEASRAVLEAVDDTSKQIAIKAEAQAIRAAEIAQNLANEASKIAEQAEEKAKKVIEAVSTEATEFILKATKLMRKHGDDVYDWAHLAVKHTGKLSRILLRYAVMVQEKVLEHWDAVEDFILVKLGIVKHGKDEFCSTTKDLTCTEMQKSYIGLILVLLSTFILNLSMLHFLMVFSANYVHVKREAKESLRRQEKSDREELLRNYRIQDGYVGALAD